MNKELIAIFEYLEREKGISRNVIIEAIEDSLRAAARKSVSGASNVTVKINPRSGKIDVFCEKEIVENVEVAAQEISLEAARSIDPECQIGQFIDVETTPKDFGRIAAQKARQIIAQKLRSAERNVIYEEYRHRINQLVSGTVKKLVRGANVVVDLGKVEGIMPMRNYPKTEHYSPGDKILTLLYEVADTEMGGAEVILSRSHPEFVKQLIQQEVPEIADGTVIIDKVVREPGYRTKFTVRSSDSKVDPVGACVGMRGVRVKNVVRELNNEKVDIIPFAKDKLTLLQNALAPIEIRKANVNEEENTVSIVVDDEDFSTVIGKKGMNARLCGQLIDAELEVQRMNDYNRVRDLASKEYLSELASAADPTLDEPVTAIEGINSLIFSLVSDHFTTEERPFTLRTLLTLTADELTSIPGISRDIADKILEQVRKQRM